MVIEAIREFLDVVDIHHYNFVKPKWRARSIVVTIESTTIDQTQPNRSIISTGYKNAPQYRSIKPQALELLGFEAQTNLKGEIPLLSSAQKIKGMLISQIFMGTIYQRYGAICHIEISSL
jgi:hypothetical protein